MTAHHHVRADSIEYDHEHALDGSGEEHAHDISARDARATNVDGSTVLLVYPHCPQCGGAYFSACYEERRFTRYESPGVALDGRVAENEDVPRKADESEFVELCRVTDDLQVIMCDECNTLYAPVVIDEHTVVLESALGSYWNAGVGWPAAFQPQQVRADRSE